VGLGNPDSIGFTNRIGGLVALPDGRVVSSSYDGTIRVWDTKTGSETVLIKRSRWPNGLCVLPDGRLAAGAEERSMGLWDIETGAETVLRIVGQPHESIVALCVLADGRLALGSSKGTIQLWDVIENAETARLKGHSGVVAALSSLPDGRLASCSDDKTIRLWDVTIGCEVARLEVDAPIRCIAALSGTRLVAGDDLGNLHWLEIVN
jgi:WD40 repeat protein